MSTSHNSVSRTELEHQHQLKPLPKGVSRVWVSWNQPHNIVGWAMVDEEIAPWVERLGPWYVNNATNPKAASPRKTLHIQDEHDRPYTVHLSLNRFVMAMVLMTEAEREQVTCPGELGKLWESMVSLPKVRPLNGDWYDCRQHNLTAKIGDKASKARRGRGIFNTMISPNEHEYSLSTGASDSVPDYAALIDQAPSGEPPTAEKILADDPSMIGSILPLGDYSGPKRKSAAEILAGLKDKGDDEPKVEDRSVEPGTTKGEC